MQTNLRINLDGTLVPQISQNPYHLDLMFHILDIASYFNPPLKSLQTNHSDFTSPQIDIFCLMRDDHLDVSVNSAEVQCLIPVPSNLPVLAD